MSNYFIKKAKHNKPKTLKFGQIKFFAHQADMHHVSVPIFTEKAANIAVLAHEERIRNAKSNKKFYCRFGRRGEMKWM